MIKKDPWLIGFLVGFTTVTVVGIVVILAWGILGSAAPAPTSSPTAVPISERVTVTASDDATSTEVASPTIDSGGGALSTPSEAPQELTTTPTHEQPLEYTVRTGDTLFDIALAHRVSIEAIQAANDLEGETILPGQVLIIPAGPLPSPTPFVEQDALVHTVSSGESLITIAEHYSVTVEALREANELESATIQPGLQLRIPSTAAQLSATGGLTATKEMAWQPFVLEGKLAAVYPLSVEGPRFTMHYQPDTPAARAPSQLYALIESALSHIEDKLKVTLDDRFDVFIAGSLFAPPDMALRGRSLSSERRNFYLFDDTGTPDERRYVIIHELTHLVTMNTLGQPASVMLHEGVAVYTGIEALEAAGFIPLSHFCAAYHQAGQLASLSGSRTYSGHIRDLDLYYAAGCFVKYLIQTYGLQDFERLFISGDYPGIYGKTASRLDAEWRETLEAASDELSFDANDLVALVSEVADAYDALFAGFDGTPLQMTAYRELDKARIAMLQARFDEAREHLAEFEVLQAGE